VWEQNNLAHKNLTVVDLMPGDTIVLPVQIGTLASVAGGAHRLEVRRPPRWEGVPVALTHRDPESLRALVRPVVPTEATALAGGTTGPVLRVLEPARIEIARAGVTVAPLGVGLGAGSSIALAQNGNGRPRAGVPPWPPAGDVVADRDHGAAVAFRPGRLAGLSVTLAARSPLNVGLKLSAPPQARPGDSFTVDLVQRDAHGQVVGGVAVRVNVVGR
jgi:hypothetical protein